MKHLAIKKKTRAGAFNKTERIYYDFIVDENSLFKMLNAENYDMIGVFGWGSNKVYENSQIDEFLGLKIPELNSGRIPLYVCSECGDIACGAITVDLSFNNDKVIWRKFGYENGYDEIDYDLFKDIEEFTFNKSQYSKLIESLRK